MFAVVIDFLCRGNPGPPAVGTVLEMLDGRVVFVFPAVEVFVAEVAGHVVWMAFGRVEIETGLSELLGANY